MKKKICNWLDSYQYSGIQLLKNKVYPCCLTVIPMIEREGLDYSTLSAEEIQNARKKLFEDINEGKNERCQKCKMLIEKEEDEIDIGKIGYFSVGTFSTCDLRCKYCYFSHEELGMKLTPKEVKILPVVKNFADQDLLKDDFRLGLAGGEPLLFEDIPETMEFIAKKYPKSSLTFLSNSSISSRVDKIAKSFAKLPKTMSKTLYTSIDAGTRETYKKIRGKDLYNQVVQNIMTYAKYNSFEEFALKYIIMMDYSNISNEDIFGFLELVKKVDSCHSNTTTVVIDRDMLVNGDKCIDNKILEAAGKLYYCTTEILGLNVSFCGGALSENSVVGSKDVKRIKEFADEYEFKQKTEQEKNFINHLSQNPNKKISGDVRKWQNYIIENKIVDKFNKKNEKYVGRKKLLYGCGAVTKAMLLCEPDFFAKFDAVSDKKFVKIKKMEEIIQIPPEKINDFNPDVIFVSIYKFDEIENYLKTLGIVCPIERIVE